MMKALLRAVRSLFQPSILVHLMWPTAVSIVLWVVLAWAFWGSASALLIGWMGNFSWLSGWLGQDAATTLAGLTATLLLLLLLLPLIYVTASLLVATVALPMILERVAERDYADLELRRGGTQVGSVVNALVAAVIYIVLLVVTLPLWLIPGMALLVPLLLSAWLNQRAYRYDALMQHADADEMKRIVQRHRSTLLLLGAGTGAIAYVPIANLFAPAFAGLAFVHYCLEALRQMRGGIKTINQ